MKACKRVLIGMGSNIDAEAHLLKAVKALRHCFGEVTFSSVYQSPAIGMDGDDFLNACCLFDSDLTDEALKSQLKALEDAQGRDRSKGSWKPRTLDLDMLMYDGRVIDDELYRYAHACVPASEIVDIKVPNDCLGIVEKLELRL